jgi:hypothetical protein
MSFFISRLDSAVWYKLRDDKSRYDYLARHVDDFIIAAKNPDIYMKQLKTEYDDSGNNIPDFYLGMNVDVSLDDTGWVHSAYKYTSKCLDSVERILNKKIEKESTPNRVVWHPEMDDSPLLNDKFRNKYQQLIGMGVWLSTIGCIDITFAIMTLSRFNHNPTEGHLKEITRVFSYLKKYPKRCMMINNSYLDLNITEHMHGKNEQFRKDMIKYYPDTILEDDPMYPPAISKPIQLTIFVDSDLATNHKDCRSITGLIVFMGCTPYKWSSKCQTCIATSTYGAEFAALCIAVEEAIAITNMLKSIGIQLKRKVYILCDNKGVIDNFTMPGSTLKKKHTSIAYHKVCEYIATGLCDIYHIKGEDNPADILTKPLSPEVFKKHIGKFMHGQGLHGFE